MTRKDGTKRRLVAVVSALALTAGAGVAAPASGAGTAASYSAAYLYGVASETYGPDVNRYVINPRKQVLQLKDHGDYYGFRTGAGHLDTECGLFDGCQEHWQGVARLAYPAAARRYLLAGSSHHPESRLAVVDLGSAGLSGQRLRGNQHSTVKPDWETPPEQANRIVRSEPMETRLNHPGGMQTIGQFAVVGMERIGTSDQGKVFLYDTSTMSATNNDPVKVWEVAILGEKVAAASIVKLRPMPGETQSRFLLITVGADSTKITFNVSRAGKALSDPDAFSTTPGGVTFPEGTLTPAAPEISGWTDDYQTLQVLVDPFGQLYLLGANRSGSGVDYLDLHALSITTTGGVQPMEDTPLVSAQVGLMAKKHMWCTPSVSGSQGCDFDAAGGAYVDQDGRLLYYATVHSDSERNGSGEQWTRMVEYRPFNHLDKPGTTTVEGCPNLTDSWVDLYDGKLSSDGYASLAPVGVNSFQTDYLDRFERAYTGYSGNPPMYHYLASFADAYGFNDRVAAAQFCIPAGYRFRLFEHTGHTGSAYDLVGTGTLATVTWGNSGTRQKWSSGCFMDSRAVCL